MQVNPNIGITQYFKFVISQRSGEICFHFEPQKSVISTVAKRSRETCISPFTAERVLKCAQ